MMIARTLVTIINSSIITLELVAIMIVVLLSAISVGGASDYKWTEIEFNKNLPSTLKHIITIVIIITNLMI